MDKIGHVGKVKGTPRGTGGRYPYYGELDKALRTSFERSATGRLVASLYKWIGFLNFVLLLTK
jgi:hypothetical protein